MKVLKERKGIIISFIIGMVVASSITVFAYSYFAEDIKYVKNDGTEISVEEALNELYNNQDADKKSVTVYTLNATVSNYGTTYVFDISEYNNYENITMDNITVQFNRNSWRAMQKNDACGHCTYTYSYNPNDGKITVTLGGTELKQTWADPATNAKITIVE